MTDFVRPTYSEILDRIQSDMDSRLEGTDSRLRRSVLNVLANMEAGSVHGLYGFVSFLALQIFPDSAQVEYLNRWGVIYGVERKQAVSASGDVNFTGSNGTLIPEGTELQRSDLVTFVTTEDVTIALGVATANVEADIPGENGNTANGSTLSFTSPIVGVDSDATVASGGLLGGLDIESDDDYLQRILENIQLPPQGGSEQDYIVWAKEVTGVTRVWVFPLEDGPGTVTVRFMMDDSYDDGIPQSGDVDDVQEYIDSKKPVTAIVTVAAPTPIELDFEIELTINPGYVLADVQDSVEANLRDMLIRDAEPGGTINLSRIVETINLSEGVYSCILTQPAADETVADTEISVMGDITWV